MNKEETILIGLFNNLSIKTSKRLYYFTGFLFIMSGMLYLFPKTHDYSEFSLGISMLLIGLFHTFLAAMGFSKNSKFAPKVKVNDEIIELKNSTFRSPKRFYWKDLRAIEMKSFQIDFQLANSKQTFNYKSTADISMNLKQTLRAYAEQKSILVTGG